MTATLEQLEQVVKCLETKHIWGVGQIVIADSHLRIERCCRLCFRTRWDCIKLSRRMIKELRKLDCENLT